MKFNEKLSRVEDLLRDKKHVEGEIKFMDYFIKDSERNHINYIKVCYDAFVTQTLPNCCANALISAVKVAFEEKKMELLAIEQELDEILSTLADEAKN